MLHNDIIGHDRAKNIDITRNLQNAAVRHHQNNPQSSMEAAFEYIMLNSATFRVLPIACIEKARKYLDLPPIGSEPVGITIYDIEYRELPQLSTEDLSELVNLVSIHKSTSETLSETFGRIRRTTRKFRIMHPIDIHNAWTQLTEMQANKPKPSTTVVHAERVVVDNRKMIKILEFENVVLRFDLPHEYFSSQPCCWKYKEGVELKYHDAPHTIHKSVLPGDLMTTKEFGQMIKTMKEAGVRLAKINKTAKLEREHSGKFTVGI